MEHIRQKLTLSKLETIYTVVITDGYDDLTTHPSIVDYPDLFEISNDEIPQEFQYLDYNG